MWANYIWNYGATLNPVHRIHELCGLDKSSAQITHLGIYTT